MVATVQPSSQATRYKFADLTLDVGRRSVARDGQALHFGRLTYDLLVALVEAAPNVVTQDQLAERVWEGRMTAPETVAQRIKLLRQALGDDTGHPRYVEVVRSHGYRLIPPVEREYEMAAPAVAEPVTGPLTKPQHAGRSPRTRAWLGIGALLVAASLGATLWYTRHQKAADHPPARAAIKSIAVLPFADLSPDRDQQYFSDGLTEEILNLLAQSPELRVIARTSSFSFRDENFDIATVAAKLNVGYVLEGSVRKSGDQLRITAQLVDAPTSSHVWSQTYDRELSDILNVQSDIAASVAHALRVALDDSGTRRAPRDPQAYERALRANFFFQRRGAGDLERARMYYLQALELEPEFARAWAGLAGVYWIQTVVDAAPRESTLAKLRDAAQRALDLDPDLTEAHIRMANYFWATGDRSAAREHWERAKALEPGNSLLTSILAWDVAERGRLDDAIDMLQQVSAADPLSISSRQNLSTMLLLAGRLDEAKAESLEIREISPTNLPTAAIQVFILERQFDEALRLVQAAPESGDRAQFLAFIYHGLGRRADADMALDELIESYGAENPHRIAEVYAYRGESDAAFNWLQKAVANRALKTPRLMQISPFLDSLHTDPRWNEWLASMDS